MNRWLRVTGYGFITTLVLFCTLSTSLSYKELKDWEQSYQLRYPTITWYTSTVIVELYRLRLALRDYEKNFSAKPQTATNDLWERLEIYWSRLLILRSVVVEQPIPTSRQQTITSLLSRLEDDLTEIEVSFETRRAEDSAGFRKMEQTLIKHASLLQPLFASTNRWSEEKLGQEHDFERGLRWQLNVSFLGMLIGFTALCGLSLWQLWQKHRAQLKLNHTNIDLQQKIAEADELTRKLSHQASYDELTGLSNRREFERQLKEIIAQTRREADSHALLFMDLDDFKLVNDSSGHHAGDELLRQLAKLFQQQIRKQDTVARLGGDEFAILLRGSSTEEARSIANKIRKSIEQHRFFWEDKIFSVKITIGIVPISQFSKDPSELLRLADSACYFAKEQGRNRVHLYQENDADFALQSLNIQWATRISQALDEDHFCLYVQPIADVNTLDVHHFEVLLRMRESDGSLVPPGSFLPAVERYNFAGQVDRWVICNTLRWLNQHPQTLNQITACSINLSGQSLSDSTICNYIKDQLKENAIPAEKICFEITETAAITTLSQAQSLIEDLKQLGCQFALDDFGSGLSSFGYLKSLPIDYLKIDGIFIKDLVDNPLDLAMVKSINELGHVFGKKTVAEYVENAEILQKLRSLGVDYAQGYFISKPVAIDELAVATITPADEIPAKLIA